MSGGEQQMCAIGRALMARPKLLLLDEPSLGLAPIFVERIFEIIRQINEQGTSILLVEQNALMALDAADRGYVLETGRDRAGRQGGRAEDQRRGPQDLPRRVLTDLRERFANPREFATSLLYTELCQAVAADERLLSLASHARAGQQPTFLLMGAVHYLAGDEMAGFDRASFTAFCLELEDEVRHLLETRLVQTNAVPRSLVLRIAMTRVAAELAAPVHLIEVGASAGVHLRFDRYGYVVGGVQYGDAGSRVQIDAELRGTRALPDLDAIPPVASAVGVDLAPVDATDPDQRAGSRRSCRRTMLGRPSCSTTALEVLAADPPRVIAGDAVDVCPGAGRGASARRAAGRVHDRDADAHPAGANCCVRRGNPRARRECAALLDSCGAERGGRRAPADGKRGHGGRVWTANPLARAALADRHREVRRREQVADSPRAAAVRHLERGAEAVHRHEPSWRAACASRQPATSTAPSRLRDGSHALHSTNGCSGWQAVAAAVVVSARRSVVAHRVAVARRPRIEEQRDRYGVCVGRGKRRGSGWTRIAVPPSATSGALRHSRSASPSPRYAAVTGFGRSRGIHGVVGGMPITTASSGCVELAPLNTVPRSNASACATDGVPAIDGRGGELAREPFEHRAAARAPARAGRARRTRERSIRVDRLLVVRIAGERPGDRAAGSARATRPCTGNALLRGSRSTSSARRQPVRAARLEQRQRRPPLAATRARSPPSSAAGPAVDDGLGRRHR